MNFSEIARNRQSCRSYDPARAVESEKITAILESARLAPSACNSQPYHITVCSGESARVVADGITGMGMNKFASDVPLMLVISEDSYSATAALGAKIKKNDYRSIDIGILSAYITAEAAAQGLGSCIIGWLDDKKLRAALNISGTIRLVICIGYAKEGDPFREKKRKDINELVTIINK